MRMLQLSPANKEKAAKLVEHASKPENYYHIGKSKYIPGDLPEYVVMLDTFRCVFTISVSKGKRYRHLSISVPGPGALPNAISAFTIVTWFGFTGAKMQDDIATEPGDDWMIQADPKVKAIQFLQPLPENSN